MTTTNEFTLLDHRDPKVGVRFDPTTRFTWFSPQDEKPFAVFLPVKRDDNYVFTTYGTHILDFGNGWVLEVGDEEGGMYFDYDMLELRYNGEVKFFADPLTSESEKFQRAIGLLED